MLRCYLRKGEKIQRNESLSPGRIGLTFLNSVYSSKLAAAFPAMERYFYIKKQIGLFPLHF